MMAKLMLVTYSSRWGIQGSAEVSEGLTAAFRYETKLDTANAESAGGVGHGHTVVDCKCPVGRCN